MRPDSNVIHSIRSIKLCTSLCQLIHTIQCNELQVQLHRLRLGEATVTSALKNAFTNWSFNIKRDCYTGVLFVRFYISNLVFIIFCSIYLGQGSE
jgi:hypothetical protein